MKVFVLISCVGMTGCLGVLRPDCRDETRSLAATARLTSPLPSPVASDTGRASFSLHEARNANTKATTAREAMWFAGSGLDRSQVTAVHVHEAVSDRLLFNIPIDSAFGPRYVITQVFTRRPYTGPEDFANLYELIGTGRTYVDVHTIDQPMGRLRGVLQPDFPNWRTFVHHNCS